jgi:hypothetical protein
LTEGLVWPPTKDDLERLYIVERLSAAKIAMVYGLRYASPKVAESTILYQLKKNGIARRDKAEHIRKVTPELVDGWVKRYEAGESLKQIAASNIGPVTVWKHLGERGVQLRDKVEAQIKATTKYERRPFGGDRIERAYLMGLRYGDLHVVRHGRAIRVRVSTTHPAMAELFDSLFSSYRHVSRYPRRAKLSGYEWTLECDLDATFRFLLSKPTIHELEVLSPEEKIAFLAGLFDAEGTVYLHDKGGRYSPELAISNTEESLLEYVSRSIREMGFTPKLRWEIQKTDRRGISGPSREGRVSLWRFHEVQLFLRALPIRHFEKTAKSEIVQRMTYKSTRSKNLETQVEWERLTNHIKRGRDEFVDLARRSILQIAGC